MMWLLFGGLLLLVLCIMRGNKAAPMTGILVNQPATTTNTAA